MPTKRKKPQQLDENAGQPQGSRKLTQLEGSLGGGKLTASAQALSETGALSGANLEDLVAAKEELKLLMGGFDAILQALNAVDSDATAGDVSNIVGFAIGEKLSEDDFTGDRAVLVYVEKKLPASELDANAKVPSEIAGIPTDVIEVGEIDALVYRQRLRPAPGGSSIGHVKVTAGTLGCLIELSDGTLCILSNNHVLANVNEASIGDPILQPGPVDGGRNPQDLVARLQHFVKISFSSANKIDAAAALTSFARSSPDHFKFTINPEPVDPALFMAVRKCGRTTEHTTGQIVALGADIRVNYGSRSALFNDQVHIRGANGTIFSQGGDSGSLIITAGSKQPVALLFAGGGVNTFANPIQDVIEGLGITRFIAEVEE